MRSIEEILDFANDKHKGQVDKAGKPYIFHLPIYSILKK